jgi:SpoVK/Ycf46/Vps4 family AAA+-type ATPase
MKDQVTRELAAFIESGLAARELSLPAISYERGSTQISFQIPPLTDSMLFDCLRIIRQHIENIRVSSFDDGHYAFQAMNRNMFKTDNMLDNIKFEFFSLVSSRCEISKKGNMSQEETNAAIETFKCLFSSMKEDPAARLRKLGATVMNDNSSMSWDYIAGYEEVKRTIRESIILPVLNPEVYDAIARMTRRVYESNVPGPFSSRALPEWERPPWRAS